MNATDPTQPPRIVSLIASSTEIVCALGLEGALVGRSHECDFPAAVRELPICTEPKFPDGTSYQIDQRIKAILQEGLSVYRVDAEALERLAPDVIITQTQCEVCAVSLSDVEAAVCDIIGSNPSIVALAPNALDDIFEDIGRVAAELGVEDRGAEVCAELRARIAEVVTRADAIAERPTVACIEWIEPLMAAGNWMPELVEMAGGTSVVGRPGEHAPWLEWDELVALDPDVIVALPCGFDVRAHTAGDRTVDVEKRMVDPRSGEGRACLSRRRQPVLQPARATGRRSAGDHGRDAAP